MTITRCLICRTELRRIISFGQMPIANGFLKKGQFSKEYRFDLTVGFCPHCHMVQLMSLVEREKMFHDHYAFYSSTSRNMSRHFRDYFSTINRKFLSGKKDPMVMEIGSNDGILLKHFAKKKIRHLGIEPSKNVADVAFRQGINTLCEFFDEQAALKLLKKHGQIDVYMGANVMCHIPYIHSVIEGIRLLLKPDGVFVFEDPYIGDIIQKTSYDQMYDEHAFYFSVHSVEFLMHMHGMEVFDVEHQDVHGGSMRYYISKIGTRRIQRSVFTQKRWEKRIGLDTFSVYKTFRSNINQSRRELVRLLRKLKRSRKRVVGYGATSKSTTVLNYCSITEDLLECIYDTTPIKIGTYSPGVHIPIRDYREFSHPYPDYALLFAWNHKEEIIRKEKLFLLNNNKFILFIPKVHIV